MVHAIDRSDIDGFWGEPAAFDATLEVELIVANDVDDATIDDDDVTVPIPRLREVALAAETIAVDKLEDDWFGNFDENAEHPLSEFDDMPTTTWQRIGDWFKNLGRAA